MKKSTLFLIIGIIMFIIAIAFVCYCLNHPTFSWDWSLAVVYSLYLLYFIANIFCFVLFGILKHKNK